MHYTYYQTLPYSIAAGDIRGLAQPKRDTRIHVRW